MSYPPSSPDGALFQILMAIGRMEQRQEHQARSLDTLIRILQEQSPSQPPRSQPASQRSWLGPIMEKVSSKVLMDIAIIVLKKVVGYLLPWSIFLGMLTWLAKALLKLLGLS